MHLRFITYNLKTKTIWGREKTSVKTIINPRINVQTRKGLFTIQKLNVNQLCSTRKDCFKHLPLSAVSFIKEDKVFNTYALIDPGSFFTFLLGAVLNCPEFARKNQLAAAFLYLSVDYEMPLSKRSQPKTICPIEHFEKDFHKSITLTQKVNTASVFELNKVCDEFNAIWHI